MAIASPSNHWAPLSNGSGLGTVIHGQGLVVDVGGAWGRFDYGSKVLLLHNDNGSASGKAFTWHLAYRSAGGWRIAVEQEPMRWGFGPLGGHLLGTSSQPFPKLRATSPVFHPTLRGWTLGRWQVDWFTGRMESDRVVPAWQQHYLYYTSAGKNSQDISRPFQSGFRVSAEFCERVQFNFGITSMWGGILPNGRNVNSGLKWYDYIISSFAGQNTTIDESSGDPTKPNHSNYHGMSNGIASFEIRFRSELAARWLGAQGVYFYVARDGENINFQWKDYLRNPVKETWYDIRHPRNVFWNDRWHSVPSFSAPTHSAGCQVHWPTLQLGLEYRNNDTRQAYPNYYNTYENGNFRAGHSRQGDSMGFMLGGGYQSVTIALDGQATPRLSWRAALTGATRAFKDDLELYQSYFPGQGDPHRNAVLNAEIGVQYSLSDGWRCGSELGWRKDYHPGYGPAITSNGNLVLSLTKQF